MRLVPRWRRLGRASLVPALGVGLAAAAHAALPAFPGAEGFGSRTPGGRDGALYIVTSLADSGPGSLREALEAAGPRIVVFEVGGTIRLQSTIGITQPFVTVAGQTAPGDGILIRLDETSSVHFPPLAIDTHDVVLRHLRIRPGALPPNPGCSGSACNVSEADAIDVHTDPGLPQPYNVVLDHLSLSWAMDDVLGVRSVRDMTVQWCIIAEGLDFLSDMPTPPGANGAGVQIANTAMSSAGSRSQRVSVHHTLMAQNSRRSPQPYTACATPSPGDCLVEITNNVVYNWIKYGTGLANIYGHHYANVVENYFKPTAQSPIQGGIPKRGIQINEWNVAGGLIPDAEMQIYEQGSLEEYPQGAAPVPLQDYTCAVNGSSETCEFDTYRVASRFSVPEDARIIEHTALEAYARVLDGAGATHGRNAQGSFVWARGPVDARIVDDVRNGTGGVLLEIADFPPPGGWPDPQGGPVPADQDRDGMPDAWETAHGLDPTRADPTRQDSDGDGYRDIEEYLNETDPRGSRSVPIGGVGPWIVLAGLLGGASRTALARRSAGRG